MQIGKFIFLALTSIICLMAAAGCGMVALMMTLGIPDGLDPNNIGNILVLVMLSFVLVAISWVCVYSIVRQHREGCSYDEAP